MTPEAQFSGTWNSGQHEVTVNLPLIIFEEDGSQIVFCPALDISGYGRSEPDALASFKINLGEFLLYTIRKKTFKDEMKHMGWAITKKCK